MSFRTKSPMGRALIACTAMSVLGVGCALTDYGLSHGLLWRPAGDGLRKEIARAIPALMPVAEKAVVMLATWSGAEPLVALARALPVGAHGAAPADHVDPPLVTAAMVPIAMPTAPAKPDAMPDVNRGVKADRLEMPELSVAKLTLPEPELIPEGASAALFLMSPSIVAAEAAPASTPESASSAAIVAGPVASAGRPSLIQPPTKNPFVSTATAAASGSAPATATAKITWNDLVRMASMKGGDGEEPTKIFGALTEKEFRARELRCMATAIYFEARDESVRGQIAVGQVIMTRVRSEFYPNTICGVVFQGQWNRNACQFSFACDGIPDVPKEQKEWETALDVAKQVVSGKVYLNDIADATHYHAVYVHPDWIKEVKRIKQIGGHIFYKAPYVIPLASDPAYQTL